MNSTHYVKFKVNGIFDFGELLARLIFNLLGCLVI